MENAPPNISPQLNAGDTERSLFLAHNSEVATGEESGSYSIQDGAGVRKVVLKDIVIECFGGDATQLGGLSLTIFGLREEYTGSMEKVSPMRWRCPCVIMLHSGIDELVLIPQDGGVMGYVIFMKDELVALMATNSNIKLECDFAMDEHYPSLRLTVTIGVTYDAISKLLLLSNTQLDLEDSLDRMENPAVFPAILEKLSQHPQLLKSFGDVFNDQFEETRRENDINRAVSAYELLTTLTTTSDKNHATYAYDAGVAYLRRFQLLEKLPDIDQAIHLFEVCIACHPESNPCLLGAYNNLGISLHTRFDCTGDLTNIESTIVNLQKAVELTPDNCVDLPGRLNDLGVSFSKHFKCTGDLVDIKSAIISQQKAVQLTPEGHADLSSWLNNLGILFQNHFERTGDLLSLESAISNLQKAVHLTPDGHADLPTRLNNLGTLFQTQFECTGDLVNIENAIFNLQKAIQLTPDGYTAIPTMLNSLGMLFRTCFQHTRDLANIQSAIAYLQKAVQLTPNGHTGLSSSLNNLGILFQIHFEHTGNLSSIESAIFNLQKAVQLASDGHADLPSWLNNLGTSFRNRFECTGDLANIESAILNQEKAVQLMPDGHAGLPIKLTNLGLSFWKRFEHTGDLENIENAIIVQKLAVQLTHNDHIDLPGRLNNLGISFATRFGCIGNLADIKSAIVKLQKAIQLASDNCLDLPSWLNNLGVSFRYQFEHTKDPINIEYAIVNQQKAIELTPDGHANLPSWLDNLGTSLRYHFESTRDFASIESAILNQQKAVQLTPNGHADLPSRLNNLGASFQTCFGHTKQIQDILSAISSFHSSATHISGPPSIRLAAAKKWALLSWKYYRSQSLDAFHVAVRLLSQVAGLEQTVHKRYTNLVNIYDLTASATAAALEEGQAEIALTWLEQGRCLVWNQLNQLHTSVDDLHAYNPSLANHFTLVAQKLEASGSRQVAPTIFSDATMMKMITVQDETQIHVHLANEWNNLLSEIHSIPKFQNFLQPPNASDILSHLPPNGHIIILNIHKDRCDALALTFGSDEPLHIPLLDFDYDQAINLSESLHQYLQGHRVQIEEIEGASDRAIFPYLHPGEDININKILCKLWKQVVKPILNSLGYLTPSSNRCHIWWCPTGPLAFLPIHAAGIYGKNKFHGSCISDFVFSSYIPTVTTLLNKFKKAQMKDQTPTSLLLISQPNSPGQSSIPAAKQEGDTLSNMMLSKGINTLLLEGGAATTARVKEEMVAHNWVHFACHAIQDQQDSLKSGMHLHDGRLELLEIMKQKIENTDHAFLSACQTSTGDKKLSEEAVHLAAGMLAVGYQGVVATMWSIKDQYAPEIATDFYTHLLKETSHTKGESQLDSMSAAFALDYAVNKIQQTLGDTEEALLIWVPYVHFGI